MIVLVLFCIVLGFLVGDKYTFLNEEFDDIEEVDSDDEKSDSLSKIFRKFLTSVTSSSMLIYSTLLKFSCISLVV